MLRWLDRLPWIPLLIGAALLGLAPFQPEPHLLEKLTMLVEGRLVRPIDIFDLLMHGALPLLVLGKMLRALMTKP